MLHRRQDSLDDLFGSIENRNASSNVQSGDGQDKNVTGKRTKRTTFMDDLFGKPSKDSASTDFTIDEKYKKPSQPSQDKVPTGGKWSGASLGLDSGLGEGSGGGRSRRRGNAILQSDSSVDKTPVNVDNLFDRFTKPPPQQEKENIVIGGGSTSQFSVVPSRKNEVGKQIERVNVIDGASSRVEENNASLHYANTPSEALSNNTNMFAINNEKLMHDQSLKMQEFEKQQQEQFQRDMEQQRNIIELKQREYQVRVVLLVCKYYPNGNQAFRKTPECYIKNINVLFSNRLQWNSKK